MAANDRYVELSAPKSGAKEERALPSGKHPIQLHSLATPNGQKVTILLEELGPEVVKYDAYLINIMKGDQFTSGFVGINPNSKIPALIDREGPGGEEVKVFESGNILLYLAEKYDSDLLPKGAARVETLNWLFFLQGAAPYFGQLGHFFKYAPVKVEYGIKRYGEETQRILDVLDKNLAKRAYVAGDSYTIADIVWYPWVAGIIKFYSAKELLGIDNFPHVVAWLDKISQRPAVKKGMLINSTSDGGIPEYHSE